MSMAKCVALAANTGKVSLLDRFISMEVCPLHINYISKFRCPIPLVQLDGFILHCSHNSEILLGGPALSFVVLEAPLALFLRSGLEHVTKTM